MLSSRGVALALAGTAPLAAASSVPRSSSRRELMVVSRLPVSPADIAEELEAPLEAATLLVALTADSSHARGRSVPLNGATTGSEGLTL